MRVDIFRAVALIVAAPCEDRAFLSDFVARLFAVPLITVTELVAVSVAIRNPRQSELFERALDRAVVRKLRREGLA